MNWWTLIPAIISRTGWTYPQVLELNLAQLRALVDFYTAPEPKKGQKGLSDMDMFNMQSGIRRVKKPL